MTEFVLSPYIRESFISPQDSSFWFGYYNYSPINHKGTRLLAQKVAFDGRSIKSTDTAEVGWFDLETKEWHSAGTTGAINWQQGAMLQWMGKSDSFVYNTTEDEKFVSKIYNTAEKTEETNPWAVYGISPNCLHSISLEFKRSFWCRAYHYESIKDEKYDGLVAEGDGIFLCDFKTKERKCIIPIIEVINFDKENSFASAKHWVEHIMINPSGNRFAFYHRFQYVSGFTTRIFTAKTDGTDLRIIDGWRDNSWSHMGWLDDNRFVVFAQKKIKTLEVYKKITQEIGWFGRMLRTIYKKTIGRFLTRLVRQEIVPSCGYQFYDCLSGKKYSEIEQQLFPIDGHPSFTADGKYMLTDTYEDEESFRHLYLYSVERQKKIELGKFYSPFNSCDYRSDLHPRFDFQEKSIVIDSAHSGYHRIMKLDVDWKKINKEMEDEY